MELSKAILLFASAKWRYPKLPSMKSNQPKIYSYDDILQEVMLQTEKAVNLNGNEFQDEIKEQAVKFLI